MRTRTSPYSVANFSYGKFVGYNDTNVGYEPAFEPYWCGKWSGIRWVGG